jgi:hypothetical protein
MAIAVAEKDRACSLDLNVLKSVIVKNFSCDLYTREPQTVFPAIKTKIFDSEPNARYAGHKADNHN